MREKQTPQKSLPHDIVLWEKLVTARSKRKYKTRDRMNADQNVIYGDGSSLFSYVNYLLDQELNSHQLTNLQKHIIRTMHTNGGTISLDSLLEEIKKIWNLLLSPSAESKQVHEPSKAVFALLVNGSQGPNPIFMKDSRVTDGWTLTPQILDTIQKDTNLDFVEYESQKKKPKHDLNNLTTLQLLIIDAITKNGGNATLDDLLELVPQLWAKKIDSDVPETLDQKIVLELTDSSGILFEDQDGSWQLTAKTSPTSNTSASKQKSQSRLTGMQDMLMRIVLSHGGLCTFDEIYNDVIQMDVNQWGSDYKRITRAILASLSHNPPGNFKRTSEGLWTVSPKAINVAKQLVQEDPKYSLNKVSV